MIGGGQREFAPDSPLEENGFEISVPRCLATANSVGVFISSGQWRLLEPPKQLYRFAEADDRSGDSPRRLSIDPNPTEASKRCVSGAELKFRIHSPPPASPVRTSPPRAPVSFRPAATPEEPIAGSGERERRIGLQNDRDRRGLGAIPSNAEPTAPN